MTSCSAIVVLQDIRIAGTNSRPLYITYPNAYLYNVTLEPSEAYPRDSSTVILIESASCVMMQKISVSGDSTWNGIQVAGAYKNGGGNIAVNMEETT